MNLDPAVARHLCLNLLAKFSQPGAHFLSRHVSDLEDDKYYPCLTNRIVGCVLCLCHIHGSIWEDNATEVSITFGNIFRVGGHDVSAADGAPGDGDDDDPFAADAAEDAAGAVGLEDLETFGTESQLRPPSEGGLKVLLPQVCAR